MNLFAAVRPNPKRQGFGQDGSAGRACGLVIHDSWESRMSDCRDWGNHPIVLKGDHAHGHSNERRWPASGSQSLKLCGYRLNDGQSLHQTVHNPAKSGFDLVYFRLAPLLLKFPRIR
jgi:hypothetical protein